MRMNVKLTYPRNEHYETYLERINLDEEMVNDMAKGKAFFIKEPAPINKALSRTDSIYSEKFGKTLQDPDSFSDRYSCECGATQGRDYKDMVCPICRTRVEYVGDDLEIFGYINIKEPYAIIHPNLYFSIQSFIGKNSFEAIIEPTADLDEDGNLINKYSIAAKQYKKKYTGKKTVHIDETYAGIGLTGFKEKFDEIIEYFKGKNKLKKSKLTFYNDIMENRSKVFIHNIPVYSTCLRPYKVEGDRFTFEKTNSTFNMLAKLAAAVNKDELEVYKTSMYRNALLYQMQQKYLALNEEIEKICGAKRGSIPNLTGGRCGFTSRSIIVPDPTLRIDEVKLCYHTLVELMQQTIINILVKTYGMGYADAYMKFYKAQLIPDQRIRDIVENIIKTIGVNVLINRNPTIAYGSIMAVRVVGISEGYVMHMPLQVLSSMAADFDGDCLNIVYVPNKEFWESAMECFNPRNAMMISHDDGKFNDDVNVFKDIIINANGLINISRNTYDGDDLANIHRIKEKYGISY